MDAKKKDGDEENFQVVKSTAAMLARTRQYEKAIKMYQKALELAPNDRNCLVARSRCHLALGDTQKALIDAENSLKEDQTFHKGIYQKAEAMYYKGDFEMALVFYHRGHNLRPELQEFRLGIQKAQEAIENSVGTPDRVKLNTTGDLSFFKEQDEKVVKRRPRMIRPVTQMKKKEKRNLNRSAANEKTIREMLGELYGDRIYLEKLMKETDSQSKTGKNIYDLVEEGLTYLDTRTEFWRQQKPMYARKYERSLIRRRGNVKKKEIVSEDYIIGQLEKIDEDQSVNKYQESLRRAQKCMTTVDSFTEAQLANKMALKAQLHSCMGNAYLELGQYQKALENHQEDYDIAEEYNLEEGVSRGLDNLGRVYARMGQFQKAIAVWETKLPLSKTEIETTWLCHEIGRCHLELDHMEKAKDFGERSLAAAELADDKMWQLHASVLIAQSEVKMGEYSSAYSNFEKALDLSRVLNDHSAEAAIKKAMDEVNKKIVDDVKEQDEETEEADDTNNSAAVAKEEEKETKPEPAAKKEEAPAKTTEPEKQADTTADTTVTEGEDDDEQQGDTTEDDRTKDDDRTDS